MTSKRLTKAEKAFDTLFDIIEKVEASGGCSHGRWEKIGEDPRLQGVIEEVVKLRVRRDKGKCLFCGGRAAKCYPRHARGRSCA